MAELTIGMVALSLSLAAGVIGMRYALAAGRHGGAVNRETWQLYAAERGWQHHAELLYPRMRGEHRDCTVEVGARITPRRSARGGKTETAVTEIRAPLRAAVPSGLSLHRRTFGQSLAFRALGGRTVSVDEDIDTFFLVTSHDGPAARELLSDLEVKKALLRLVDELPDARLTEREVVVELQGMVTDISALERYLDAMTGVVAALRGLAPERPEPTTDERPLPTATQLPILRERLTSVLRRMGPASRVTGVQTASLRVSPYEFDVEVRAVAPGVSRLGIETGGRLVRGLVDRAEWRIELVFDPEYNALLDAVKPGDHLTGTLEVDEVRLASRTLEAHALGPPIPIVPRGTLAESPPPPPDPDA